MTKDFTVNADWRLLTRYVYAHAWWTINVENARRCQVGVGLKIGGKPRGERKRFIGYTQITTLGVGGIYVRAVDGEGPCSGRLDLGDVGLVPIPSITFP